MADSGQWKWYVLCFFLVRPVSFCSYSHFLKNISAFHDLDFYYLDIFYILTKLTIFFIKKVLKLYFDPSTLLDVKTLEHLEKI